MKNPTNPTIGNSQRGGVSNRENYTPGPSDYHVDHVLTQAPRYVRPIKSRAHEVRNKGNLTARVNIEKECKEFGKELMTLNKI